MSKNIDCLVLAGDIEDSTTLEKSIEHYKEVNSQVPIFYIPGNHTYYGSSFKGANRYFEIEDFLYNNRSQRIGGLNIHGSVLWTNIDSYQSYISYGLGLNDIRMISDWSFENYKEQRRKSLEYLYDVVDKGDVVVTHHSPSYQCTNEKWRGHYLNRFFHNEMESFIESRKPSAWMFGHIHDPVDMYIGDTRVVANPMGYRHERPDTSTYDIKVIEI